MLTIQPNVVNYSNRKPVHFRGGEDGASGSILDGEITEDLYNQKSNFYKSQIREFDKSINDEHTPDFMKKVLKTFRIISEALLEGWAVAWGASKGSKVIKSSVVKGVENAAGKQAQEVLTPFGKKLEKGFKKVGEVVSKGIEKIKTSSFGIAFSEKLAKLTEKMNQNSVGKYIVKGFEYIGNGIKAVVNFITKPFKGAKVSEVYDKATKATSTTLGVGAGAAGAYNATAKVNDKENQRKVDDTEQYDDINDDFDDDYDLEDDGE